MHTRPILLAARYFSAGLLAASTLAFAQDQPSATNSNGGWKRVGSAQVYNPPADSQNGSANAGQYPQYGQNQPPYGQNQGNDQYGQNPTGNAPGNANEPPPPPVPPSLTIQRGTYLTVRVNQMLSSDKNQPGDAFTATLTQPVVVNGVVVAEPGQTLGGQVVTAQKHSMGNPGRLGLQLTNLTLVDGQQVPVRTQFISRQGGTTSGGQQAGTVATTTGLGAAIGAAADWGTGAAIGAGAGAAAGLIGVLVTRNHASVIYPEQVLTFRIEAPVTFSTQAGQQAFRYVQPNEYDRPPDNGPMYGAYGNTAPPPAAPPYYAYGYPYPYYGYGYPYWGPSISFYYGPGFWWGGRWYRNGYYRGWDARGYARGRSFESHGRIGGGSVRAGASSHGGRR